MQRKAQAAMEFLMTYGWAILVVLAAIGALAYFGVLSPDQFVQDRCTVDDFACNNHVISTDSATISMVNQQPRAVTVHSIALDGGCFDGTPIDVNEDVPNRGETSVATFDCPSGETNTEGSLIEVDLTVNYQREGESINRTATGEFLGRAE